MNIENESAVISLQRLKSLEKTQAEIDSIKENLEKERLALTVTLKVSFSRRWLDRCIESSLNTFSIGDAEVSESVLNNINQLNSFNEKLFANFIEAEKKYMPFTNMSFIDRLKHLFFPKG